MTWLASIGRQQVEAASGSTRLRTGRQEDGIDRISVESTHRGGGGTKEREAKRGTKTTRVDEA
jgi:hypothetical protein